MQESTIATTGASDLNFNHPIKELIWIVEPDVHADGFILDYVASTHPVEDQLKLNGHDRFAVRDSKYFTRTQIWEHHTGCGGLLSTAALGGGQGNDGIAVYSFALKPEEHQPSGTCNFSRIDAAHLKFDGTPGACNIYAVNYNVLRIMSGMGGLAYSN